MTLAMVLDTNVVLDALVFANPAGLQVWQAIKTGQVQWIATMAMRQELTRVLGYQLIAARHPQIAKIQTNWDRYCHIRPATTPALIPRCRCRDPDDQPFIELALNHAQYLLSRDRAVLKVARPAWRLGLHIMTPQAWLLNQHPQADG